MSKLTQKIATVSIAIATVAALSGPVFAQSTADLQAQIAALLAQINSLQSKLGTASVSTSGYNFATNLTLGSKGADVTALQNVLISGGFLKIAAPTAFFGPMTKAAVAAWQKANSITPAVGYVGAISRAKLNSMATASTGTSTGTTVPVSGGAVSVGLASDNPVAQSVMVGNSQIVPVLSLNFSAGSSNVTVTGLSVVRGGLSSDQELNNVYLLDGSKVIATNLSVSNGVVNFTNASGLFSVNMNSTKKITVAISIVNLTASGHTYQFSLASASAVTSNASSVQGSFPVSGNTLTSASVSNAGGVTITNNSSGILSTSALTVNAGQTNYIAGEFTVEATNQTVSVRSLKLTLVGSVNPTDIANIKLFSRGTQLGGTLASIDANNVATFDLSASPLQLTAGQTVQLYVYVDVNGTVSRYFQFSVQHNYDVIAQDMMYNVGVLPTVVGGTAVFPVYFSYVNVQTGNLTVTRNAGSPVNYILPGGTNQAIAKIDMKAVGEAVRITALNIDLTGTGTPTSTITNVKVVDDQGTQIGTTQQTVTALTPAVAYTNLNYVISSGATRTLTVYADLSTAATGNVVGGLTGVTGQGYTSLAALTAGSVYGNTLSANATLLSVFLNSALGNTTVVAGQNGAKVGSFALVAGAASDVSVSSISLVATSSQNFQNLTVKVAGAQVGQVQPTIANGTTYNFSFSTPVTIPKGGQLIVDAYADVKTTATTTAQVPAYPVYIPATTGVSATAVSTSQVISSIPTAAVNGQSITTAAAGTATYALYNTPAAGQVGMGSTGVVLATYKVTGSANENMTLNTVYLQASSTVASVFTNLRLVDAAGKQWGSSLNLAGASTSSTLQWVGVNIPVAQNGYVSLSVVGDASSWQALQGSNVELASSNATTSAAIYQIDFIGASSNQTGSATSSAYGFQFDVLRTTLSPATAAGVTLGSGAVARTLVGAFTISAGAGNDVTLSTLTLTQTITNASTSVVSSTVTIQDVQMNQDVASSSLSITGTAPVAFNMASSTVTAGTTKTYYVYSDTTGARTKPANSSSPLTDQISLTAISWSDGTRNALGADARFNLPLTGGTATIIP